MKKKGIIAVIVIAAAAVGAFAFLRLNKQNTGGTAEVYVQSVNSVNSAGQTTANRFSGVVENQKSEEIKFDTSKMLKECYVKEGDTVEEGTKLFAYDTESIDIEIQQKELNIERLNATIENDNKQIAVLNESLAKAAAADQVEISASILELQAAVAQAEYDIKVATADIEKLKSSKEKAEVTSPMKGTVTKIADLSGLSLDDSTYITVTADGQYRVKGTINEQNIFDIYEGMAVILRSRADDTITWKGTISTIDTQPKTDEQSIYYGYGDSSSSSSKYAFYVEPENVEELMLGQHLIIERDTGINDKEGIWLTSGWMMFEGNEVYCMAASSADGRLEKRKVEIGEYLEDQDIYQIVSGLDETEYLAWPDQTIQEGMQVTTNMQELTEETEAYDQEDYADEYDEATMEY